MNEKENRPARDGIDENRVGGGEELRETMVPVEPGSVFPWRLLLLLLLLVAAIASGVLAWLARSQLAEPTRTAAVVEKRPIVMPIPPTGNGDSASSSKSASAKPIVMPVPPAPAGTGAAAPGSLPEPEPVPAPAPASGPSFALETAPYRLPDRLGAAERRLKGLGFEPVRIPIKKEVAVTRLLIGIYPSDEAQSRLAELAETVPDAFPVLQGNMVAVYAGTYQDLDKARSFADQLYQKGIRVEEEPTLLPMTVHLLRFGRFADREAAMRAAAEVRSAGIEAAPVVLR